MEPAKSKLLDAGQWYRARLGKCCGAGGKERPQAWDGDSFGPVPVTSHDGGGSGERVENRFFRSLDGGADQWVEMSVGQMCE